MEWRLLSREEKKLPSYADAGLIEELPSPLLLLCLRFPPAPPRLLPPPWWPARVNAVTLIAKVTLLFLMLLPSLLLFVLLPKNEDSACGDPTSAVSDSCVVPRSVQISAVRARGAKQGPDGVREAEAAAAAAAEEECWGEEATTTGRAVAHASSSVLAPPPLPPPPFPPPLPFPPSPPLALASAPESNGGEEPPREERGSSLARNPRVTKAP